MMDGYLIWALIKNRGINFILILVRFMLLRSSFDRSHMEPGLSAIRFGPLWSTLPTQFAL